VAGDLFSIFRSYNSQLGRVRGGRGLVSRIEANAPPAVRTSMRSSAGFMVLRPINKKSAPRPNQGVQRTLWRAIYVGFSELLSNQENNWAHWELP